MTGRYVGIDLNEKYAMISCYADGMSEPSTFSMVTGSEVYQIPLCVSKRKGVGQWFFGEEAKRYAREEKTPCIEGLLKRALVHEPVEVEGIIYDTAELLFVFLKKLLGLPLAFEGENSLDKLVITLESVNQEVRELLLQFAERILLPAEKLMLVDYRESFYYYALSQSRELCLHDVALYYYTSKKLLFFKLSHDRRTVPQVVTIDEKIYDAMLKDRDAEFAVIAEDSLAKNVVSSVYLIGDGFEGNWLKRSLSVLCRNRRTFMGKNLFCKGACYAAAVRTGKVDWQYIYLGDSELKVNVSLKVRQLDKTEFLSLLTAGDNWYEAGSTCEVILSGKPSIDLYLQPPKSREAVVKTLDLDGFPDRKDKMSRLRITAKPVSADKVSFTIRDMGFGELVKSSDKVWEYEMSCDK